MKKVIFAEVNYLNKELRKSIGEKANKKFGEKNSYTKNLWILSQYRKEGGKISYEGKKPSEKSVKENVSASVEVDVSDYALENIDLLAFLEEEDFQKASFLNAILSEKETEVKASYSTPYGPVTLASSKAATAATVDDIDSLYDYIYNKTEALKTTINERFEYLYNKYLEHLKGHLPSANSVEQLQRMIKALGLDSEYEVIKKKIHTD